MMIPNIIVKGVCTEDSRCRLAFCDEYQLIRSMLFPTMNRHSLFATGHLVVFKWNDI